MVVRKSKCKATRINSTGNTKHVFTIDVCLIDAWDGLVAVNICFSRMDPHYNVAWVV